MVGCIIKLNKKEQKALKGLISAAERILEEASKDKYCSEKCSIWPVSMIQKVVLPEAAELLLHAKNGEIYCSYSSAEFRLESYYMMCDSSAPLDKTRLGELISELQNEYRVLLYYYGKLDEKTKQMFLNNCYIPDEL